MSVRPFERLGSKTLFEASVFTLRCDDVRSPRTGHEMRAFVLETGGWVNVVPVTPQGDVVLVRQWRHGTRSVTLEIPGGLIDPEDESPAIAAARELREETGYEAARLVYLGTVLPNPAIQSTVCHTFLAEDVRRVGAQNLDHGEDIVVETVPLARIPALMAEGEIRHALVVAAFAHLERYRAGLLPVAFEG